MSVIQGVKPITNERIKFPLLQGPQGPQGIPGSTGPQGVAGTSGMTLVSNEIPTGLINATNRDFTTLQTFIAGSTRLFLNGVRQFLGADSDYSETSTSSVRLASAPEAGDILVIDYAR